MRSRRDSTTLTKAELLQSVTPRIEPPRRATREELLALYRSLEARSVPGSSELDPAGFGKLAKAKMLKTLGRIGLAKGRSRARKAELVAIFEDWYEAATIRAGESEAPTRGASREPSRRVAVRVEALTPMGDGSGPFLVAAPLVGQERQEVEAAASAELEAPSSPELGDASGPFLHFVVLPADEATEIEAVARLAELEIPSLRLPPAVSMRSDVELVVEPVTEPARLDDAMRTDPASEARTGATRLEVDIGYRSDTNFYVGFSGSVSGDGGIFVATVNLLELGRHVQVTFVLPSGFEVIAHGVVAWVREARVFDAALRTGMGIAFSDLSPGQEDAIDAYVRRREPLFYVS